MTQTVLEARPQPVDEVLVDEVPGMTPRPSLRGPILAMAAGALVLAMAATVLVNAARRTDRTPVPAVVDAPAVVDPLAITLAARDVSVVEQVYGPGEASGWHLHSGIHAVAVQSGVLTVYDGQCQRQTFEPGRPYVGGQELHLVRNEGTVPVVMSVTYLSPAGGGQPTRRLPAPAGCVPADLPLG